MAIIIIIIIIIIILKKSEIPNGYCGGKKKDKINRQGISELKIFWFLIKMSISIFEMLCIEFNNAGNIVVNNNVFRVH